MKLGKTVLCLLMICSLLCGCGQQGAGEKKLEFNTQYVRTDGIAVEGDYESFMIRSAEELDNYIDEMAGYERLFEACTGYDEEYFKEKSLAIVLLEEPSGSISHKVTGALLLKDADRVKIEIERIIPETLTCDMAQWHILIELQAEMKIGEEDVEVALYEPCDHELPEQPQTVSDPVSGYCGNTQTTLYLNNEPFTFWGGQSVTLTDILINLDYNPRAVCKCPAEYRADTEFASGYEINLSQGFVRCEKGQGSLTQEQLTEVWNVIQWAKTQDAITLP